MASRVLQTIKEPIHKEADVGLDSRFQDRTIEFHEMQEPWPRCCHHWLLEPAKVVAKGHCKKCGEVRRFDPIRGKVTVLAKRIFLSINDPIHEIAIYARPGINVKTLARLGDPSSVEVYLNGATLEDCENLFDRMRTGDHISVTRPPQKI